jgi:spore maturation protein CgeB
MRFVIFGLTVTSSWGNGHATLWRALCRALGQNGHAVTFFEKDVPYYRAHRDLYQAPDYKIQLYSDWREVEASARREVRDSDCSIVTSYCPDAHPASNLVLEAPVILSVFYDLDTPVTLSTLGQSGSVDYIPPYGLAPFDLVLSYTGGRALGELSSRLGAKRVAPLYGSVDPRTHKRTRTDARFSADLSYLGTYAPDRQHQLEELFLKPAKLLPEKRFCLGGALYPADFPWTNNTHFVRHLPPPEHPAFYSSSRLTLNVTRAAMAEMGFCPSGRMFEAAACGTPIISDWWDGLDTFFEPGRELLIARTSEDVIQAMDSASDELERVSRASQRRTLAEHTATNRATELVRLIEGAV